MTKPTEFDENHLLASRAAVFSMASHQKLSPDEAMRLAQQSCHVGCTGACEWAEPCNCSHSVSWMAPRQPRKPEETKSTLKLRAAALVGVLMFCGWVGFWLLPAFNN